VNRFVISFEGVNFFTGSVGAIALRIESSFAIQAIEVAKEGNLELGSVGWNSFY
jgi:hypothetical protein